METDAKRTRGSSPRDQLKNMKLIIDLDTMADWIRQHCPGNFDNPEWFPDFSEILAAAFHSKVRSSLSILYTIPFTTASRECSVIRSAPQDPFRVRSVPTFRKTLPSAQAVQSVGQAPSSNSPFGLTFI